MLQKKALFPKGGGAGSKPGGRREGKGVARQAERGRQQLQLSSHPSTSAQGLTPLVNLRPPATTTTESTLQEEAKDVVDFLQQEDEDLLDTSFHALLSTPTDNGDNQMETEVETPANTTKTPDKLLSLRKDYKKTSVSLIRAKAHLGFLSSCKDKQQTPKGLKTNVQCSAFLADLTDVQRRFSDTSKHAEEDYVSHLTQHYQIVSNQLQEKRTLLLGTMESLQTQGNQKEREEHLTMLKKTDENLQKLSKEVDQKKKRKLENFSRPPPKKKRLEEGSRGRNKENNSRKRMVSPKAPPLLPPPAQPLLPQFHTPQYQAPQQQSIMNLTLADLFAGLQGRPLSPQLQTTPYYCTLGSGRPPQPAHPSGKGGLGQSPQLSQPAQQSFGLPPQLQPQIIQQAQTQNFR